MADSRIYDAFTLDAQTPRGTSGAIAVPAGERALVVVNGRIICHGGTCTGYQARQADGSVQLTVPGGRYDIVVVG